MLLFNQQDYQKDFLGDTKETIAKKGCTTTDIAEIYDFIFKKSLNPAQVSKKLAYTDKKHYPTLAEGLVLWGSLENLGLKLVSRITKRDDVAIARAYKNPNQYIILEVNHNHWVWLIGTKLPFLGYRIADPWFGDKSYMRRYNDNITGCAIISSL